MTMQDSASFWTDIKHLEEQLSNSPDSFCFARLADVYLKVGLIDDALHVARQGVLKHPGYLSGQRVLSLACHAKGLNDEALTALKLVTEAVPEDVPSQKLLGRLYSEAGNQEAACQTFRTALEFAPDDAECRIELESLERSSRGTESAFEPVEDEDEIIEDLEILEELDVVEEEQPESGFQYQETPPELDVLVPQHHDPLSTGTLAELYVSQGFIHKALEIYRAILVDNPEDRVTAERLAELEALQSGASASVSYVDDSVDEAADESEFGMPDEELYQVSGTVVLPEPVVMPALETRLPSADSSVCESTASTVTPQGVADNALSTLDRWLENIRRIKSCR
ncbi:MAG: tetratricopeptide repeat protein [Pelobacteraceae bacterium]